MPGGQEFSIARPLQRNGKWIVRHADKLILRTFERCYITIVCPPSIDHAQILYGKVDYDCIAVWILKQCPKPSSTTKNGTADKLPFENMQNTKIDEQSESDHTDAKGGESSINATLIDATDESKHTDCEHQQSADARDLEEPSTINPHRSDASKQSHNCKDVDMAESSKLDDAMLTFQNQKSQKTGLMTACSDKENKTDVDTSMLVEVSEVNLLSGTDLQNVHNQHADDRNGTEDEPDPISSFSPVPKNPGHEEHPLDGCIPQHKQVQVATSKVRQLASPQHTRKKRMHLNKETNGNLRIFSLRMQILHLLSVLIFTLTVIMTTMSRLLESNRATTLPRKRASVSILSSVKTFWFNSSKPKRKPMNV